MNEFTNKINNVSHYTYKKSLDVDSTMLEDVNVTHWDHSNL